MKGDSVDRNHKDWFDVTGFSLSVRADTAQAVWSLALDVPISKGNPTLHSLSATNRHIDSNSGSAPNGTALSFSISGDGTGDSFPVQSFSPPSQQGSVFGDATLTYSSATKALVSQLLDTAAGEHIPSLNVGLFKGGARPFEYAAYGFIDVHLHSVAISGDTVVSAFNARELDWTVFPQNADGSSGPAITAHFP